MMDKHNGGGRSPDSLAAKVDFLFRTVRRSDGREYTYDEVEKGSSGRVSRSYIWKLRHGRNRNPSLDVLQALAHFFGVPGDYFFTPPVTADEQAREAAELAALLQHPQARAIARRARTLSRPAQEAVLCLIEHLQAMESPEARQAEAPRVAGPV